jgi:L-ascorbate metabolism protein UlaG (beta-lactamase superfamily)
VAALAVQRFFKLKAAIPCHYGSFPIIEPNADRFVAALDGKGTQVIVPQKNTAIRI